MLTAETHSNAMRCEVMVAVVERSADWGLVLRGDWGDKIRIIDRETSEVATGEAEIGLLTA